MDRIKSYQANPTYDRASSNLSSFALYDSVDAPDPSHLQTRRRVDSYLEIEPGIEPDTTETTLLPPTSSYDLASRTIVIYDQAASDYPENIGLGFSNPTYSESDTFPTYEQAAPSQRVSHHSLYELASSQKKESKKKANEGPIYDDALFLHNPKPYATASSQSKGTPSFLSIVIQKATEAAQACLTCDRCHQPVTYPLKGTSTISDQRVDNTYESIEESVIDNVETYQVPVAALSISKTWLEGLFVNLPLTHPLRPLIRDCLISPDSVKMSLIENSFKESVDQEQSSSDDTQLGSPYDLPPINSYDHNPASSHRTILVSYCGHVRHEGCVQNTSPGCTEESCKKIFRTVRKNLRIAFDTEEPSMYDAVIAPFVEERKKADHNPKSWKDFFCGTRTRQGLTSAALLTALGGAAAAAVIFSRSSSSSSTTTSSSNTNSIDGSASGLGGDMATCVNPFLSAAYANLTDAVRHLSYVNQTAVASSSSSVTAFSDTVCYTLANITTVVLNSLGLLGVGLACQNAAKSAIDPLKNRNLSVEAIQTLQSSLQNLQSSSACLSPTPTPFPDIASNISTAADIPSSFSSPLFSSRTSPSGSSLPTPSSTVPLAFSSSPQFSSLTVGLSSSFQENSLSSVSSATTSRVIFSNSSSSNLPITTSTLSPTSLLSPTLSSSVRTFFQVPSMTISTLAPSSNSISLTSSFSQTSSINLRSSTTQLLPASSSPVLSSLSISSLGSSAAPSPTPTPQLNQTAINPANFSWTQISAPSGPWNNIFRSSSGQYLVGTQTGSHQAGYIYVSSNYGTSWTRVAGNSLFWIDLAGSSSGQYLIASENSGHVWISSNYGATWGSLLGENSVASSSSGQYLATTQFNRGAPGISTSSNYGSTWTTHSPPGGNSIASSSSGQYLAVCGFGTITVSSNYGSTWSEMSVSDGNCGAIVSSDSGQYLAIAENSGYIYVSSNYGTTWTQTSAPNGLWGDIASSSSGQYLAACQSGGGYIYISSDYGATWTKTSAPSGSWSGIAISSNATQIIAVDSGGSIWVAS